MYALSMLELIYLLLFVRKKDFEWDFIAEQLSEYADKISLFVFLYVSFINEKSVLDFLCLY